MALQLIPNSNKLEPQDLAEQFINLEKVRKLNPDAEYLFMQNGTNLALLSGLLGHTTTTMTLHYFINILGEEEVKTLMD